MRKEIATRALLTIELRIRYCSYFQGVLSSLTELQGRPSEIACPESATHEAIMSAIMASVADSPDAPAYSRSVILAYQIVTRETVADVSRFGHEPVTTTRYRRATRPIVLLHPLHCSQRHICRFETALSAAAD